MKKYDILRDLLTPDWALFERMARERPRPMRKGSKHKPEARAKMSAASRRFMPSGARYSPRRISASIRRSGRRCSSDRT